MNSSLPAYCALPYKPNQLRQREHTAPIELCYLQAKRSWCQGQNFCVQKPRYWNFTSSPTNSCDSETLRTQLNSCALTEISSFCSLLGSAVHRLLFSERFEHKNSATLLAVISICGLVLLIFNWVDNSAEILIYVIPNLPVTTTRFQKTYQTFRRMEAGKMDVNPHQICLLLVDLTAIVVSFYSSSG